MEKSKKWVLKEQHSEDLVLQILSGRGCKTEEERNLFLDPPSPQDFVRDPVLAGFEQSAFDSAITTLADVLSAKRAIFVHGDYDVDGICATAILWKTIYQDLGYKNCLPFIPNRFDHGYGLSKESIDSISNLSDLSDLSHLKPLLITVDCGITSFKEVEYAKEKGFEVLVLDHHVKPEKLPECKILWTEKLCAAAIAWVFSEKLRNKEIKEQGDKNPLLLNYSITHSVRHLDLAALATIADIQPLTGPNRSLVKYGLEELSHTQNVGLKQLIKASGIEGKKIGTFEVGWILSPRLNASGRLEEALSSLRLLCTSSVEQAAKIAGDLNRVNAERQELTKEMVDSAKLAVGENSQSVNVVVNEQFHEGIIGLIAGKLASHFGRPAVVIKKGEEFSKASARSVIGFNIVEFLRSLGDHFENVGGHAGAAGFTIRTEKIDEFLVSVSQKTADLVLPPPVLEVDTRLEFNDLSLETLKTVKTLEPFGLGNPEPVFLLEKATIVSTKTVGSQNQHLKLKIAVPNEQSTINNELSTNTIDCIGFDMGSRLSDLVYGDLVNLIFSLSEDTFSGYPKLVLRLKDLEKVS